MPKTEIKPSPSRINSIEVILNDESHTVAAPLVERMLMDKECLFAAYKLGHQTDKFVSLTIQGSNKKNARMILEEGLKSIIKDLDDLITQVKDVED